VQTIALLSADEDIGTINEYGSVKGEQHSGRLALIWMLLPGKSQKRKRNCWAERIIVRKH
jgi:hypothetical protein